MTGFTESVIEQAALAWLESAGRQVHNGAEIAAGEPAAVYDAFGQVNMVQRLCEASLPHLRRGPRLEDAEKLVGRAA